MCPQGPRRCRAVQRPTERWQRGEQIAGLYLAQDPDTVWAEWYRALAELGEAPDSRLPRDPMALPRPARTGRRPNTTSGAARTWAARPAAQPLAMADFPRRRATAREGRVPRSAVSLKRPPRRPVPVRVRNRGRVRGHNTGRTSRAGSSRARATARHPHLKRPAPQTRRRRAEPEEKGDARERNQLCPGHDRRDRRRG